MNIQKNIQKATYFIERLKSDLPKIKNENQRNYTIDMLNSFIVLINTLEFVVDKKVSVDSIDKLILGRVYSQLYQAVADGVKVDMSLICRNIDADLNNVKEVGYQKIVNLLRTEEVALLSSTGSLTFQSLSSVTPEAKYKQMLERLVGELKQNLVWN